MIEFFNAKMQEAKLNTAPGNPVIAAQINLEQNFAFIEVHCYGLVSFLGICLFAGICVFYMIGTTYTCINGLKLKLLSAKSDNKGKIAEKKGYHCWPSFIKFLLHTPVLLPSFCQSCHVAGGGGFNKILLCFECRMHLPGVCI